jgi:UDP-N-acetylglucosamine--N-acetylmuramyl-(pentapeptide) pyrophosphoryl-undecaprenol N-acetylglucosamine transferase
MKKIIFTGGGSAGHVTVNLALIPHFIAEGWKVDYIGSENGIEKQLISGLEQVPYHSIATGKLRRYFDWNNFKDPFKVIKGVFQAYRLIKKLDPDVVFSKGGFVSVPVILGAWLHKVPIVIHESDITPGLANRISIPFATKVCATFPETVKHLPTDKAVHVGAIVRNELKQGSSDRGFTLCQFTASKPVLLIMGGSLGSQRINQAVRANLNRLLERFQVIHICGKGQIDPSLDVKDYKQFEYVNQELPDMMAIADMIVSRAGSNSIFEFLALRKPMLLIPLSRQASRGDQILNAQSFRNAGFCEILWEEELTDDSFLQAVTSTFEKRAQLVENMKNSQSEDALAKVIQLIEHTAK